MEIEIKQRRYQSKTFNEFEKVNYRSNEITSNSLEIIKNFSFLFIRSEAFQSHETF